MKASLPFADLLEEIRSAGLDPGTDPGELCFSARGPGLFLIAQRHPRGGYLLSNHRETRLATLSTWARSQSDVARYLDRLRQLAAA